MAKVKQISIATVGLKKWLNDTKRQHNNKGYDDFCEYLQYRVPYAAIGRLFHVHRYTITKWKEQKESEEA